MSFVRSHRRGRAWLVAALGIYALVLVGSPILHHDLACHLKSPTHCEACVANPVASRIETGVCLGESCLTETGLVETQGPAAPRVATTSEISGRSPPA